MNIKKPFNTNIVLALICLAIIVAYIIYPYIFPELAPWMAEPNSKLEMWRHL